jgi:hypothetical protein
MGLNWRIAFACGLVVIWADGLCLGGEDGALAPGVAVSWSIDEAEREATATRERICINGLWRWQPAERDGATPPDDKWGFFKVPGCWPGIAGIIPTT